MNTETTFDVILTEVPAHC